MTTPILTTKLYVPPSHPKLVSRTHLIEQLNSGLSCRLTLISAPAGFGKSTLLSAWVQQIEADVRVAWLSLDEGDNDLTRFLTYFIAALQTIETDIGQGALAALQSSGLVNTEGLLTSLLNEIANFPGNAVLILDDYHVIESQPIDQAITFLLDHLPPQMHLIVASRIDPSWPLSRLRVRGQITEIRADDLRFAIEEAIEFLNQVMGLKLSTQDVTSLEGRTEGWIAGLHLAALSIQGLKHRGMIADFVNRFTGSDRYIQDYLADEVLQQQSDQVKDFLLHTSILNRLTAPLCNSVTKMENSQIILEKLENANLFIVPLDNERRWYRYHHLFADLLNHRLRQIFPDQISDLHQRASEWYEQHDFPSDAIRHAFSAKNLERAAALAELAWPAWNGSFQSIEWLSWLKALPAELVRSRPVLCVAYAWAFLNSGDLEAAETRLLDAEHWLEPTVNISERPDTRMVVVDDEQFQSLPVSLATARAYHAQATGDVARTVKYAKRVLDLSPDGDSQYRGDATALLGLAHWTSGDIEAAHQTLSDGLAVMKPLDVIIGTFVLAEMKMTLGHLHEAIR
nr:AAA family ATPase [Chloroflexota bacterium]